MSATGRLRHLRHSVRTVPANPLTARHPVRVENLPASFDSFQRHGLFIFLLTIGGCNHVCLGTLHNLRISDRRFGRLRAKRLSDVTACRGCVFDALRLLFQPCGRNIDPTTDEAANSSSGWLKEDFWQCLLIVFIHEHPQN